MAAERRVLINSDMGEAFGLHSFGNDPELMQIIDLANIACGFHAGDPGVMRETVALAEDNDVLVGSHPGLPDLAGFGRRRMAMRPDEVEALILYQTGALLGFLQAADLPLNHVKPHGALWGMLAEDAELMRAAARAVRVFDVPFLGLAGTQHERVCAEMDLPFIAELYVDMNYNPDGTLALVRSAHETDPRSAADRVATALRGEPIAAIDGSLIDVRFQSVCVHSDSPNAPDVARAVRAVVDA
ncbi:5-oxoprolinase subunit PxpA [Microbacterium sp. SA39]|uniref:5-oxoprolinase subunit PxpA n=1 Tax=Microbacterium sp. SA39 TaxID=1263625 RepID=UPI0005FA2254|nr:5-oxoprolinase subunit PxpA [Microbacterium sp. SA39]KJQ52900.1 LamB/YcsF family protein [Microbacterium sp. SA39]